ELSKIITGAKGLAGRADLMVCPPATLIAAFAAAARGSPVAIGAQDCHAEASGAHTGDISAEMLADAGARAVIVGHSERRADHQETDADVRLKARAAWRPALPPSFASASYTRSAKPAKRWILSADNSTDPCRMDARLQTW